MASLMLGQIRRLDGVVESLLGMVQPIRLHLETVVVQDWLATLLEPSPLPPGTPPPRVLLPAAPLRWTLDPQQLGRAVHNLLRNAAQHADPGSEVTLQAEAVEGILQLQVCNRGAPIAEPIAAHLFEPSSVAAPTAMAWGWRWCARSRARMADTRATHMPTD